MGQFQGQKFTKLQRTEKNPFRVLLLMYSNLYINTVYTVYIHKIRVIMDLQLPRYLKGNQFCPIITPFDYLLAYQKLFVIKISYIIHL